MKNICLMMMAAVVLMTACEKAVFDEQLAERQQVKDVSFNLSTDDGWTVTRAGNGTATSAVTMADNGTVTMDVTRTLYANTTPLTDLFMYDCVGGDVNQAQHLTSDFDMPSMMLDYGEHAVKFVASRGASPVENDTEHTIVFERPSDTFWASKAFEVTDGSSETVDVELSRVVTKLRVNVTDQVPSGISRIVVAPATWYLGVNYLTAEPCAASNYGLSVAVPSSYAGTTGQLMLSIFGFSGASEWTTAVTITAYDSVDEVIGSVTVANVPLLRNRTTDLTGPLFSGSGKAFNISIDDEWSTPVSIDW